MKDFIKNKKLVLGVTLIVVLTITNLVTLGKYLDSKSVLYSINIIPHLKLDHDLAESDGIFSGEITGFVAFENTSMQPSGASQYYKIYPSSKLDSNGNQIFIYEDIIKLPYLAPSPTGDTELFQTRNSAQILELVDEYDDKFTINKVSGKVSVLDRGGDSVYLITNYDDYRDFINMREY
jgi:hypothetical protein